MAATAEMIRSYPADLGGVDRDALVRCIRPASLSVALAATSVIATPPVMSTAASALKRAVAASRHARN
jgi:hypothetical protein